MNLETNERHREGIVILDCKGRIVLGSDTEDFRNRMRLLFYAGVRKVILNLLGVKYIDSSGLGELIAASRTMGRDCGFVKLLNLKRKHVELLVMTKLTTIFELYDDEQQAVNSFFPDRAVRSFDLLSFVREIKQETT